MSDASTTTAIGNWWHDFWARRRAEKAKHRQTIVNDAERYLERKAEAEATADKARRFWADLLSKPADDYIKRCLAEAGLPEDFDGMIGRNFSCWLKSSDASYG